MKFKLKINGDELEVLWCLVGDAAKNNYNDSETIETFNLNGRKELKNMAKKLNKMMDELG